MKWPEACCREPLYNNRLEADIFDLLTYRDLMKKNHEIRALP